MLTRTRSTNTNEILSFGGVRFPDGGYDDYGTGVIHWCKIWYDDLGDTNCRQLASWSHEPIRMEYYGNERYRLAGGSSKRTSASFICNHLLAGRTYWMNSANTNAGGWNDSLMRKFLNTRVYNALPTVWKSMIKQIRIPATAGSQSTEMLVSDDYIYLPCLTEMNNSTGTYAEEGDYISWYTSNPSRVKFHGRVIPDGANYITSASDPTTVSDNNVKEGDVWINSSNGSNGYIYITQDEVDKYKLEPVSGSTNASLIAASIGGAWRQSNWYWLRSPNIGNTTSFWLVGNVGGVNGNNAGSSVGVCPCFSI